MWRRLAPALTFVNARVLIQRGVVARSLRLAGGRVDALEATPAPGDSVIDADGAWILPGLINAHDHLAHNSFPRFRARSAYTNATEWFADCAEAVQREPAFRAVLAQPRSARLLAGRLKNLLGGTTLVVHHDRFHHTLRRAGVPAVLARYHWSHSLALDGERVRAMAWQRPRAWPWFIHAAEGTDAAAAGEFARLARLGALQPNTVLVHGIALSAREQTALVASGAGLVWCPSSNLFLYGTTADVRGLAAAGRVALGTDARLSGAGDLLDELRAAAATGQLPAPVLFDLVTERATRLLRTPDRGHLRLGARADLFLLPGGADPYTALLEAKRADLGLVVCGGRPVIGDPDFAPAFAIMGTATTPVRLDGRPKLLATALARAVVRAAVREPGLDVLSEP